MRHWASCRIGPEQPDDRDWWIDENLDALAVFNSESTHEKSESSAEAKAKSEARRRRNQERLHKPLAQKIKHAGSSRSGFDPRQLFRQDWPLPENIIGDIGHYYELGNKPILAKPSAAASVSPISGVGQVQAGEASVLAIQQMVMPDRPETISPQDPGAFYDQLFSEDENLWQGAAASDSGFAAAALNQQAFQAVLEWAQADTSKVDPGMGRGHGNPV